MMSILPRWARAAITARTGMACLGFVLCAPALMAQAKIKPQDPPPGNPAATDPSTDPRVLLGHILFFEEQVSATRTVSCATCHLPEAGGTDPRLQIFNSGSPSVAPGEGSAGVIRNEESGNYVESGIFGLAPQGTSRKAPSFLTGSVFKELFWDGRAAEAFKDESMTVVSGLETGAALESQAVGPPISEIEMAHIGSDWSKVVARLQSAEPLALAVPMSIPTRLQTFIANNNYPEMFDAAFNPDTVSGQTAPGPGVTRRRFAMAVAAYQRTLLPQQAPVLMPGSQGSFAAAWGGFLFEGFPNPVQGQPGRAGCSSCHQDVEPISGGGIFAHSRKTDNDFHNIGLVDPDEDPGRFLVTNNVADKGKFKTPSLFNVALQNQFFHHGAAKTLGEVIDHYIAGGDPTIPGNELEPLFLRDPDDPTQVNNAFGKIALLAYLEGFTDPRLEVNTPGELPPPFDRPTMYSESSRVPELFGQGTAGTHGTPAAIAIEPPWGENPNFTVGVQSGLSGKLATLWIATAPDPNGGSPVHGITLYLDRGTMVPVWTGNLKPSILVPGSGYTSVNLDLTTPASMIGVTFWAQWVLRDPAGPQGLSASEAFKYTFF